MAKVECFYDSLVRDERVISLQAILVADFIIIERIDNKLAGIGGVRKSYGLIPSLFLVVKSKFSRKGIGNKIMESVIEFARERR